MVQLDYSEDALFIRHDTQWVVLTDLILSTYPNVHAVFDTPFVPLGRVRIDDFKTAIEDVASITSKKDAAIRCVFASDVLTLTCAHDGKQGKARLSIRPHPESKPTEMSYARHFLLNLLGNIAQNKDCDVVMLAIAPESHKMLRIHDTHQPLRAGDHLLCAIRA